LIDAVLPREFLLIEPMLLSDQYEPLVLCFGSSLIGSLQTDFLRAHACLLERIA
jgi:hypothetical protein